jgi:N-acetylglutamate synthase-like GNAT family acetyltransferase
MNIVEVEFATPEYDQTVHLRYKILREPLDLDFTEDQLAAEYSDFHLAAYDDAWILRGCLVLTPKDEKVLKMRQVAVDNAAQSKGIGSLMVKASEVFARAKGYDKMELNARETAIVFYQKLGYNTEGPMFEEVSISHFKMVKNI